MTVKVLKVHCDDPSAPYYTIGLPDGKGEKQTSLERLEKPGGSLHDLGGADNLIDALFGIEMESELTCNESTEETKVILMLFLINDDLLIPYSLLDWKVLLQDRQRKLVCNIQGGGGSVTQISDMKDGIKLGFLGEVEKRSDVLGRNAVWKKQQYIKYDGLVVAVSFLSCILLWLFSNFITFLMITFCSAENYCSGASLATSVFNSCAFSGKPHLIVRYVILYAKLGSSLSRASVVCWPTHDDGICLIFLIFFFF